MYLSDDQKEELLDIKRHCSAVRNALILFPNLQVSCSKNYISRRPTAPFAGQLPQSMRYKRLAGKTSMTAYQFTSTVQELGENIPDGTLISEIVHTISILATVCPNAQISVFLQNAGKLLGYAMGCSLKQYKARRRTYKNEGARGRAKIKAELQMARLDQDGINLGKRITTEKK